MSSYRGAALELALLALAGSLALAQSGYELRWFAIGGGGGSMAGGGYTLRGTAGQAQAGALAGGGYTLQGGFWVGASEQRVSIPLLQRQ